MPEFILSKFRIFSFLVTSLVFMGLACVLTSCFTGIESTKKINMTREDKKIAEPTPEEKFFSGVAPVPINKWEEGKNFIVADDKVLRIFETAGLPPDVDSLSLKGKLLHFYKVASKINAAGIINLTIIFTDGESLFRYDTGKEFEQAVDSFTSDEIPMLIDEDMVTQARELLKGKTFWTKSSLWYDSAGQRIDGLKYVPVTVTDVLPGDLYFPLMLKISSSNIPEAYMYMNFGNDGNESRAFHNLFFLNDIRKNYPNVREEIWEYISSGKVTLGMTKEECRLALGSPADVNSGHDYSQTLDKWGYEDGTVLWFEDGRLTRFRQ